MQVHNSTGPNCPAFFFLSLPLQRKMATVNFIRLEMHLGMSYKMCNIVEETAQFKKFFFHSLKSTFLIITRVQILFFEVLPHT